MLGLGIVCEGPVSHPQRQTLQQELAYLSIASLFQIAIACEVKAV